MEATALTSVDALRVQLHKKIALASEAEIRQIARSIQGVVYPEVAPPEPWPEIPASLVKPSDEQLARELADARRSTHTYSSEEAYAMVREHFSQGVQ